MQIKKSLDQYITIAAVAHRNQTRWDGSPYILHALRVMIDVRKRVEPDDADLAMKVAVMHDIIEDTAWEAAGMLRLGYDPAVVSRVELLSRPHGMPYMDYIARVATDKIARAVKLADLADNMSSDEVGDDPERQRRHASMMNRYRKALDYLQGVR